MQKASVKTRNSHHKSPDLYGDLQKIKAMLAQTTSDARHQASDYIEQSFENVKDKSMELQDSVTNYVAEKPLRSLGFAMLAGIAIGFLIKK